MYRMLDREEATFTHHRFSIDPASLPVIYSLGCTLDRQCRLHALTRKGPSAPVTVTATAPTRIDLAGGTLDIWPLYLFMGSGITINAAVTIRSLVTITPREDSEIHLHAADSGDRLSAENVDALPQGSQLDLLARTVRFYRPRTGVEVTTSSEAPRGSGIGASSSLIIALSHALNRLNGTDYSKEQIIDISANLEAQMIDIPTGKQDYHPPSYGGVNAVWFEVGGDRTERLGGEKLASGLEARVLLSFTGISHFSGTNNWAMMKRFIDKRGSTPENLRQIRDTALDLRECLMNEDWDRFPQLVNEEWENRRALAKGVSNARVEKLTAAATAAGAQANKLCGAGGGGCMISVVAPEKKEAVRDALRKAGARPLDYRIDRDGVQVNIKEAGD
ncbi:MAG: GHMP kinase [Armatimonadetes bacterium]|nr:GHMP kinase [Armatimonadota bacterium]